MQPDLEYSMSAMDLHSTYAAEQDVAAGEIQRFAQVTEPVEEPHLSTSDHMIRSGKLRWWQRPSPTLWRLTLIIGDGILLVALLVLVLVPFPSVTLKAASGIFGITNTKLIWIYLALA